MTKSQKQEEDQESCPWGEKEKKRGKRKVRSSKSILKLYCMCLSVSKTTMLFASSFFLGPFLGFPVQDVDVTVQSLTVHPDTSHTMISACVSRCMQKVQ